MNEAGSISAAVAQLPPVPLPEWPPGWYVVARGHELAPGAIRSVSLAGRDIVVFRTHGGALGALDAYCPHMGAHLARGRVHGEQLECALHCWRIDRDGVIAAHAGRARAWRVVDNCGLVMLDLEGARPLPRVAGDDLAWTHVAPLDIGTSWHGLIANAFDMPHLCTVHQRELLAAPEVSCEPGKTFALQYQSRVRGRELSDLMMKWLSHDRISVIVRCYGTVTLVETDLGFTRTAACIGMTPTRQGTRLYAAFGVRPGNFLALRLALTRWLFASFLRRDLGVVEGMRLKTDVDDVILRRLFDFLRTLRPVAP